MTIKLRKASNVKTGREIDSQPGNGKGFSYMINIQPQIESNSKKSK